MYFSELLIIVIKKMCAAANLFANSGLFCIDQSLNAQLPLVLP